LTNLILWRFVAKPESIAEFERAYGEQGLWAIGAFKADSSKPQ